MDPNETKIYTVILIASIVLGIILAYFIFTIVRYQRKNLILHNVKLEAEITTLENERKRIASDLHDELGPLLSTVKLHINSMDSSNPEDQLLITKASMHIDSILTRIREISNNLMPQALVRKGLAVAMREFIGNLQSVYNLQIIFLFDDGIRLGADLEIHLYRILLEIIQNTIKYAVAKELKIECRYEKNKLLILIADNGQGFEYNSTFKTNQGLGLKNIISRVEIVKGSIYIDTAPGKGTRYFIEIPN